jgi:hypothetical protein
MMDDRPRVYTTTSPKKDAQVHKPANASVRRFIDHLANNGHVMPLAKTVDDKRTNTGIGHATPTPAKMPMKRTNKPIPMDVLMGNVRDEAPNQDMMGL